MAKIIGITGKAGAGKDTVAEIIERYIYRAFRNGYDMCYFGNFKFADPLKYGVSAIFDFNPDDIEFETLEEKNTIDPYWGVSKRELYQFIGTEVFRNQVTPWLESKGFKTDCKSIWVHTLAKTVSTAGAEDIVVISDVRFQDEVDWILEQGGVMLKVERPDLEEKEVGIPNHTSEKIESLNLGKFYLVKNDGELAELEEKVELMFELALKPALKIKETRI